MYLQEPPRGDGASSSVNFPFLMPGDIAASIEVNEKCTMVAKTCANTAGWRHSLSTAKRHVLSMMSACAVNQPDIATLIMSQSVLSWIRTVRNTAAPLLLTPRQYIDVRRVATGTRQKDVLGHARRGLTT